MTKKVIIKLFSILVVIWGFIGVLGFTGQYAHAIPSWFGNTDWVTGGTWDHTYGTWIWVAGTEYNQNINLEESGIRLIDTIKKVINWALGLLALIALILVLRGGFQMLFAAGDDGKFKKWRTILRQAAIALAFIGLSWLMVSLIFYVIGIITE